MITQRRKAMDKKTTYVEHTNLHRISPRQETELMEELGELSADLQRYPPEEGAS